MSVFYLRLVEDERVDGVPAGAEFSDIEEAREIARQAACNILTSEPTRPTAERRRFDIMDARGEIVARVPFAALRAHA